MADAFEALLKVARVAELPFEFVVRELFADMDHATAELPWPES